MKKFALIILALFLSGCYLVPPPSTTPEFNIYKGKQGIAIKFVPGAPPDRMVASGEPYSYDVKVIVENRGAADAKGIVALILEKNFMEAVDKYKELEDVVEGKEKFLSGGIKDMSFVINTKELNKEDYETNPQANIQAAACYEYKTKLSAPICIDTSAYRGVADEGACKESVLYFNEGQVAPVAVTKIEPVLVVRGNEIFPYIKIFVGNVGSGEILRKEHIDEACSDKPAEHNIIYISKEEQIIAEVGGKQLSCSPEELRVIEGSDDNYFMCTLAEGTAGFDAKSPSFVTDLSLELNYGYETTTSKKTEIVVV